MEVDDQQVVSVDLGVGVSVFACLCGCVRVFLWMCACARICVDVCV